MAAEAKKIRYGQNAVYGSLAYDFNNPALYPDEEYGAAPDTQARPRPQEQVRVRTRARTAPRTKQGISPVAIAGVFVAAFLFVLGIMAQIQLLEVSDNSVALQRQLDELETEQTRLKIAYESAFNLTEIEEYAISELGMQKPRADQIYYIDTSSPDKAQVVAESSKDSFADRVGDFISGLCEYFR